MTVYIYGLFCPDSDNLRYIGKSKYPERRFRAHIYSAKHGVYSHHTSNWIKKLLSNGKRPVLKTLREVQEGERWQDVERRCIAEALDAGAKLTNSTLGGEGLDYADPAAHAAWRRNHFNSMKGFRASPEGKAAMKRMSEAAVEEEALARRTESIRKRYKDPELVAKMSVVNTEINSRPEVKAKKSKASKEMWKEKREHFLEVFASPETKKAQSEKRIAAWADPVVGAKLREIHSSAEVRAKKSEAAKRRATPEYRAMMAEKTRLSWIKRREKAQK